MGQNGNMFEWNESAFSAPNDFSSEDSAVRGGDWNTTELNMRSSLRNSVDPAIEVGIIGFRVASVPEPSTAILMRMARGSVVAQKTPEPFRLILVPFPFFPP